MSGRTKPAKRRRTRGAGWIPSSIQANLHTAIKTATQTAPRVAATEIGVIVYQLLGAILQGEATMQDLADWAEVCCTWSRVAELTRTGEAELSSSLRLATNMLARMRSDGRVVLDAPETALLKATAQWVEELMSQTPERTLMEAAIWSEAVKRMALASSGPPTAAMLDAAERAAADAIKKAAGRR